MMRCGSLRPATWVMVLMLGAMTPAFGETGPVCREPSVVDEIGRVIRAGNYYSEVQARLITEQPTNDPRVVRCQVCVENAPYDTLRFGEQPIARCLPHDFEVLILSGGFVVRDLH